MYKVKYGFIGALIGGFLGLVMSAFLFMMIVGLVIGVIIGTNVEKAKLAEVESKRQAEEAARVAAEQERARQAQEAMQAEENLLYKWKQEKLIPAIKAFDSIESIIDVDNDGEIQTAQPFYNQENADNCKKRLNELKSEAIAKDKTVRYVSYQKTITSEIDDFVRMLNDNIQGALKEYREWKFDLRIALADWLCQLAYVTGDTEYLKAANAAYLFCVGTFASVTQVNLNDYGNIITPVDTDEKMNALSSKVALLESKIKNSISQLMPTSDKYYSCVAKFLYPEMSGDAEKIMWYYAKKKPFDTEKFESSCNLYGSFARKIDTHSYDSVEMIARIFSKQAIGGETTVEADRRMIEQWIDAATYEGENRKGQNLASALAWMELYRMELNVLKQLVQQKVQLHENVQERLRFLSEGGTSNIKVYDVLPSDRFLFDSSSENWDEKEISICFRNLKMKKIELHYSLVISGWKKTMPLANGQKLSESKLYTEFQDMVSDFDGEIICSYVFAKAIDLANLEYPNAVLFQFTSERNRCISMIFHCEKFGRNLNITILTLFTPEENLTLEEMEKYALAIKGNVYVNSFQESILQTVDDVLKEDTSIYEDDSSTKNNTFFE